MENPSDARVALLLRTAHRIAIVGLSSKPERPSYNVARYLLDHGYEVIPVNPHEQEVLGRQAYARLADVPGTIDVVDIFRRPKFVPGVVAEAVAAGVGAIWTQLGVISEEGAVLAAAHGLTMVMDRCMEVEHARLVLHGARFQADAGPPLAVPA
ncbi:MAG TPA: CoA-binding protein [Chloroflexota bacterium]|jgi:hypothetical protein